MKNGIPVDENTMVELLDVSNYLQMDWAAYFGDYRPSRQEEMFGGNY